MFSLGETFVQLRRIFDKIKVLKKSLFRSGNMDDYLPAGAPLLDYLIMETKGDTGWKFPIL